MERRPGRGSRCGGRAEYAQTLSSFSFANDFGHVGNVKWYRNGGDQAKSSGASAEKGSLSRRPQRRSY